MQSIKDIIPEVVKNLSEKESTQKNISETWKAVAGKESDKTDIVEWKKGILKIHVDSPARVFKLNLRKSQLIKKIQKEIIEVEQIIFKVGKISAHKI